MHNDLNVNPFRYWIVSFVSTGNSSRFCILYCGPENCPSSFITVRYTMHIPFFLHTIPVSLIKINVKNL